MTLRRMLLTALIGPLSVLLAVGAGVSPASAETKRGSDPRGDGQQATMDGELVRSDHADGDIVGYRISYNRKRVTIGLRYRELAPPTDSLVIGANLVSPRSGVFVTVNATRRHRAGSAQFLAQNGRSCRVRHRIDYRRNYVSMSFPSRCIKRPRAIRVQLVTAHFAPESQGAVATADGAPGRDLNRPTWIRVRRG